MNEKERLTWLEARLHQLSARDKDNFGARRKIMREIRKQKKAMGKNV